MKDRVAARYIIQGRVQGVGYRNFAKSAADQLGLKGYARNLDDGTVEVLAIGPKSKVEDLRGHLERGPRFAEVRSISHHPEAPTSQHSEFTIQ